MIARGWKWIAAMLLVAAVVHGITVLFLPRFVMLRTMNAIIRMTGAANAILHAPGATWRSRAVVRPSPDLLYSICVYDLGATGAVRVSTPDVPQSYWSVSVFDADTNNYYAINDRQAKSGAADFILVPRGKSNEASRLPVVAAPTNRGIVLFRTLVNDEADVARIDAARHNVACEPYKTEQSLPGSPKKGNAMTNNSKVRSIELLACDAGWRNYHFVKIMTESGIVGWSEFDEGFGSPGVGAAIQRLSARVVGQNAFAHERIYAELFSATRPAAGGVVAQALGAIENALLDAKAKLLGVPCYELLGGKIRDRIRVYWSHCATWRINHPGWYKPAITDLDGVKAIGREVREKKFTALKTNIFTYDDGKPTGWRPGFGVPFQPEINVDRRVLRDLRMHLEAIRDGAGPDIDILLDLNFNAKTEGYLKILRAIADLDMFWIEIDSFSPEALGYIRRQSPHPISSCETLLGLREFLPYFREQAMDVAIIDTPWNGVWQSMKIAASAEHHEVNVAPHNFYGHLCTMMNAHFSAAVPNLRIMETDIDRLAWDHELFTHVPEFVDGHLVMPDRPGWGTEPDEEGLKAHPPKGVGGLLNYGRKA